MLPLRVAIDATPLGSGRGGDETYLRSLLAGLALVADERDRFPLFLRRGVAAPPAVHGHPSFPIRVLSRGPSPVWFGGRLPLALALEGERPDLLVSTTHAPLISPVPRAPIVHDLSFRHYPEHYPAHARARLNAFVPLHARQARLVITVSEFSRRDLIAELGLSPDRVVVVPNAVALDAASADKPDAQVDVPYFLYVGNLHPRKNVPRLIDAFLAARAASPALAGHRLIIAGAAWWGSAAEERAAQRAPSGSVVLLGRVSDARRDALLRGAVALAYPSLFEGFGLPPLEALAAGTPVVASDAGALPEVLGDAAILVAPTDVGALAAALVRIATDEALRAELRARGLQQAGRYSLRNTGERALDAFRAASAREVVAARANAG